MLLPFPLRSALRGPRHRAAAVLAAVALGAGAVVVPLAHAQDGLEKKQDEAQRDVRKADRALDESSARFRAAQGALDAAQARLDEARSELASVRGRLITARARVVQVQAELDLAATMLRESRSAVRAGQVRVQDQRDDVADLIADVYVEGDPDLLAIASFLDAEDPADLVRGEEARRMVVGQETRAYDELRAAEVLLLVEEEQVEDLRDRVAAREREAQERLAEVQELEQQALAVTERVRGLVTERAGAAQQAARVRAADLRALREAERDAARIKELLRRRAAAAVRAGRSINAGDGYLSYPVQGYVTSPYGMRTHPIYGYRSLHDGVDFGAACGAPLRASAPGRVVSRYYQTAYGNRMVLDHGVVNGAGLASVYNHATSYTVGVGEFVERGEVVGYVGSTGWSTGCHLHFTVMRSGNPVDPMGWF